MLWTLSQYTKTKFCVTCSSGTDALLIPLLAKGIGPGDAVITTPFTYIATAEVISLLGAIPIFVDIYPTTFNLDPSNIQDAITYAKQKKIIFHASYLYLSQPALWSAPGYSKK